MRVLTFGWDFPPHTTGGLGFACHGLSSELSKQGVEVLFVLPRTQPVVGDHQFIFADHEHYNKVITVNSLATPYHSSQTRYDMYDVTGKRILFSRTILEEVYRYAQQAIPIAQRENFDLIHAHDWSAYLAGVAAKRASGKPLILHVHATSFDQAAGDNVDPEIFKIEQEAFAVADSIVAISHYVKNMITTKHGADPEKISVIHNGSDAHEPVRHEPTLTELRQQGKRIVLYHGRITVQKGVDYFVKAARRVVDIDPNVIFVISGKGDMENQIMQQVAGLRLSANFIFAGALWYEDRDRMYQSADLIVMPSVSEPFGLVPLEAMQHGTPAVISKQSGVSEVMSHVLTVDFWDTDEMANKILAALRYPVMHEQMVTYGKRELWYITWDKAAKKIKDLYQRLLQLLHTKVV